MFLLCLRHFQLCVCVGGGGVRQVHIVSLLSIRTMYLRPVHPVCNTNGFCLISFEKIGVLD